ncbi:MmgE/PrpD family protein [Cryobacterium sp. CG_9.6]|uniref:MmgE/PrpD family protein n=1 Tax=Cryobacterium sp. CG_9.6 TaxID=2760710 RepID=UPI0024769F10|nr:MmgE/PrpD family protein [Cryobacterium sp. CG_9.6]MDH6238115.1 2-methylcitrate dehydratase PrpD [Cryobacterium sp. CG_9.6]
MSAASAQIAAVNELADFAADLRYRDLPLAVRERLTLMLVDLLGVTAAGARTPELTALAEVWPRSTGSAPIIGTRRTTSPETAAYLNAIAACCLELDEGNKHAQGHPAAHVVFSAMAAVQLASRPITGAEFLTAVAAGYEVAARFGRALDRKAEWHTHGHWGVTGAACAAALIMGASRSQIAAAIDTSTALMNVTPWATVLGGNFVRNLWVASANMAGLQAARLALAGLADNNATALDTLGNIVGELRTDTLTRELGTHWLLAEGYVKQHSSCSYTHAAVDAVQSLKARGTFGVDDISSVRVRTHSLAKPLFTRDPHNRLSAMFSLPFVVSSAIVNATLDPAAMEPGSPEFESSQAFSARVSVETSAEFDRQLPLERWSGVDITLNDGSVLSESRPNPIGDVDYFPMGAAEIEAKLTALLGTGDSQSLHHILSDLEDSTDAVLIFNKLSAV